MSEQSPEREGNTPAGTDEQLRQMGHEGGAPEPPPMELADVPPGELKAAGAAARDGSDTGRDDQQD